MPAIAECEIENGEEEIEGAQHQTDVEGHLEFEPAKVDEAEDSRMLEE